MSTPLVALLLALQPTPAPLASAAQVKPQYRAHRTPSCAEWRTARTGRGATPLLEAGYNIWFHGYITGYNVHGPDRTGDLLGTTKWVQIGAFIDDYCARNSTQLVADALQPLIENLSKRPTAPARQSEKRRAMMTVTTTCREWTGTRNDQLMRVISGGAVRGYLTAYNRWGPDPAGDVLGPGNDPLIDAWIDKWCDKRPSALLMQAVSPLTEYLTMERAAGSLAAGKTPANEQLIATNPDRR